MNWIKRQLTELFQKQLLETFIKGYLADFIKRQKGYVVLISVILAFLQLSINIITSPDALYYLNMVASLFADIPAIKLTPEEIVQASTAITLIWGIINKFIKASKGLPQVPTIIIEKEVVKNAPLLKSMLEAPHDPSTPNIPKVEYLIRKDTINV